MLYCFSTGTLTDTVGYLKHLDVWAFVTGKFLNDKELN